MEFKTVTVLEKDSQGTLSLEHNGIDFYISYSDSYNVSYKIMISGEILDSKFSEVVRKGISEWRCRRYTSLPDGATFIDFETEKVLGLEYNLDLFFIERVKEEYTC